MNNQRYGGDNFQQQSSGLANRSGGSNQSDQNGGRKRNREGSAGHVDISAREGKIAKGSTGVIQEISKSSLKSEKMEKIKMHIAQQRSKVRGNVHRETPPVIEVDDELFHEAKMEFGNMMNERDSDSGVVIEKYWKTIEKYYYKSEVEYYSEIVNKPKQNEQLLLEYDNKKKHAKYNKMAAYRTSLPVYSVREEIMFTIDISQVVVLHGKTGSGKTSQVPQYILDHFLKKQEGSTCRIVCSQLDRVQAISNAQRVAVERMERLRVSVGYKTKLEPSIGIPRTSGGILYCTPEIVLQMIQANSLLSNISHLILDDVHRGDLLTDLLLCILKNEILPSNFNLKLILISDTLNAEKFVKYFSSSNCKDLLIPGVSYQVEEYFLEDVLKATRFEFPKSLESGKTEQKNCQDSFTNDIARAIEELWKNKTYPRFIAQQLLKPHSEDLNIDLIVSLICYIVKNQPIGNILVILPGLDDLHQLMNTINNYSSSLNSHNMRLILLHSLMSPSDCKQLFEEPPEGIRKIIIGSDLAETVTFKDICYVIDCGKINISRYDPASHRSTVLPEWVTLSNAKERLNRANSNSAKCYHLFSKIRESHLKQSEVPEVKRISLLKIILELKVLKLGKCKEFFSKFMTKPQDSKIKSSLWLLRALNALDDNENLTPLGFHMSRLPVDPFCAKLLVMGALLSCFDPILTVAAAFFVKDPFVVDSEDKLMRHKFAGGHESDHKRIINVYYGWEESIYKKSEDKFLSESCLSKAILQHLREVRRELMVYMHSSKLIPSGNSEDEMMNRNSGNMAVICSVIAAGFYPYTIRIIRKPYGEEGTSLVSRFEEEGKVRVYNGSVNHAAKFYETDSRWIVYCSRSKCKFMICCTTVISSYPIIFFGKKLDFDAAKELIYIDDFVTLKCNEDIAKIMQFFRKKLDKLVETKICYSKNSSENIADDEFLSLIVKFLEWDDQRGRTATTKQKDSTYYEKKDQKLGTQEHLSFGKDKIVERIMANLREKKKREKAMNASDDGSSEEF